MGVKVWDKCGQIFLGGILRQFGSIDEYGMKKMEEGERAPRRIAVARRSSVSALTPGRKRTFYSASIQAKRFGG